MKVRFYLNLKNCDLKGEILGVRVRVREFF